MGFGILFIGYTLILCMSAYSVLPSFIGYFIGMYACLKLSEYEDRFKLSAWGFAAGGTVMLMQSVMQFIVLTSGNTLLSDFASGCAPVFELVFYAVQMTLLPALVAIARDTGRSKTVFACKRNMILFPLMFVLFVVANIMISMGSEYGKYLLVYVTLSRFAVLLLMMIQVFSCYMWICREGEEEQEQESALNKQVNSPFVKKRMEREEAEKLRKQRQGGRKKK
ncbi:MAG: hypothetical protein IJX08_00745 [Clostridia bacterium]|nr:hypothetical protein [Clostridia bacterium]MBQ8398473.1 hypothetical protein [Clostridia bacterium]